MRPLVAALVALVVLTGACSNDGDSDGDAGDTGDTTPTGEEEPEDVAENGAVTTSTTAREEETTEENGGGEPPEPLEQLQCSDLSEALGPLGEESDQPPSVDDLLLVLDGTGADAVGVLEEAEFEMVAEVVLEDPAAVAEFFNRRYCPSVDEEGEPMLLTTDDVAAIVEDSVLWTRLAQTYDLLVVPTPDDDIGLEEAEEPLADRGIETRRVYEMGALGHVGAFPGAPHVELRGKALSLMGGGSPTGRTIAIVDTGFLDRSTVVKGVPWGPVLSFVDDDAAVVRDLCSVSHGEFVASIVRQLEPETTIYGVRAFRAAAGSGDDASCWGSDEVAVLFATARLELAARLDPSIRFDAINYSLGAIPHDEDESSVVPPVLESMIDSLTELGSEVFADGGEIVAAAGNHPAALADDGEALPVYPAAFDEVVGVGAVSTTGGLALWIPLGDGDEADDEMVGSARGVDDDDGVVPIEIQPQQPPDDESGVAGGTDAESSFERDGVEYWWVDVVQPGCHLIGDGSPDANRSGIWSGSSFASGVYAARRDPSHWYTDLPEQMYPADESHVAALTDTSRHCAMGMLGD